MNLKRVRGMVAAGSLGTLAALAMAADKDWIGTTPEPGNVWSTPTHWSPTGVPQPGDVVRHLINSIGQPEIRKDADAPDGALVSFEGQLGSSDRILRLLQSEPLNTTGNVFRTGTGGTSYTILLEDGANMSVGGDLYGFIVDFQDDLVFATSVNVGGTWGYGPVKIMGNFSGSALTTLAGNAGRIDCLANDPAGNPIANSPWTFSGGGYSIGITSATIDNVGSWLFAPGGLAIITTNNFDMFANGGTFEIHNVDMLVLNTGTFSGANPPKMTFDGSSQLIYGRESDNFIQLESDVGDMGKTSFLGAASLLKPTSYPTSVPGPRSLEFHLLQSSDAWLFEIDSKVSRDALAFDAALADLVTRATPLEVEAFASDVCNVQFVDHLVPDGSNPVSSYPENNRCVKYWNKLQLTSRA